jgi:hypothetical protein
MSELNFLKVTTESVLEVLQRLALHYPRSKQVANLDLLAPDYAYDCRAMRQGEFEAAAARARAKSKYFPTSAHILEAWDEIKQERRQVESDELPREYYSGPCTNRAKQILDALKSGMPPDWGKMQ